VSAHPKVDRRTGEMIAFGYNIETEGEHGAVDCSVINKDRKVTSHVTLPISSPRMIHDFAITKNYCIIPDLPMEFRPDLVFKGKFIFHFD
jgi:carotenoid cleavage dioxygenase-like enzyme